MLQILRPDDEVLNTPPRCCPRRRRVEPVQPEEHQPIHAPVPDPESGRSEPFRGMRRIQRRESTAREKVDPERDSRLVVRFSVHVHPGGVGGGGRRGSESWFRRRGGSLGAGNSSGRRAVKEGQGEVGLVWDRKRRPDAILRDANEVSSVSFAERKLPAQQQTARAVSLLGHG